MNEMPPNVFSSVRHSGDPLRELLTAYYRRLDVPNDTIDHLLSRLHEMRVVFLFDGLDEIPNKDEYILATEILGAAFLATAVHTEWRLLMSCRAEDYDGRLEVTELQIQPLSAKQIDSFFKRKKSPSSVAEKRRMRSWRRLKSLDLAWFQIYSANPYFLAVMLESLEDAALSGLSEPRDINELFEKTIRRELRKVPDADPAALFENIFRLIGETVSLILIRKSSRHEDAVFDLADRSDAQLLARMCKELAERQIEPFYTVHEACVRRLAIGRTIPADQMLLSRCLDDITVTHVNELLEAADDQASLTQVFVNGLGALVRDEVVAQRVATNALDSERGNTNPVFVLCCAHICAQVIARGTRLNLFARVPGAPYAIRSFRHRRVMEFLAATAIDRRRTLPDGQEMNLWLKQTICMVAAISANPAWLLQSLLEEPAVTTYDIADVVYYVHRQHAETCRSLTATLASRLAVAGAGDSAVDGIRILGSYYKLVVSGHVALEPAVISTLVEKGQDVSLYPLVLRLLDSADADGILPVGLKWKFLRDCARNAVVFGRAGIAR
jgi:hypothetical protein